MGKEKEIILLVGAEDYGKYIMTLHEQLFENEDYMNNNIVLSGRQIGADQYELRLWFSNKCEEIPTITI